MGYTHGLFRMEERRTTRKGAFLNPSNFKGQSRSKGSDMVIMTGMLIRRGECLRVNAINAVASRATCGQHATHRNIRVIGTREELYDEGRAKLTGYHRKCMGMPGKPLNIRSTVCMLVQGAQRYQHNCFISWSALNYEAYRHGF